MKHLLLPRDVRKTLLSTTTGPTPASGRTVRTQDSLRQLERGGRVTKEQRSATTSWPARKARRDTQHSCVATPACDGTKTSREPRTVLSASVPCGGGTCSARAWTCVAGHNILPLRNSKQTSAARLNTPHKRAHTEQQNDSRGGTAVEDNRACTHELDTEQSSAVLSETRLAYQHTRTGR